MKPPRPWEVIVCGLLIRACSRIVPPAFRDDWRREWEGEVWHRWQFLLHAQAWNRTEGARLIRRCLGTIPDSCWHWSGQGAMQGRLREYARSPWSCLGVLIACCLSLALATGGLPALRNSLGLAGDRNLQGVQFIWLHPAVGGGDEGLPADVVTAWSEQSRLLSAVAPFVISHAAVRTREGKTAQPLLVRTKPSFFQVVNMQALNMQVLNRGLPDGASRKGRSLVLTDNLSRLLFRRDARVVGSKLRVGGEWLTVSAVLPAGFGFLSRQPTAYLLQSQVLDSQVMIVARSKPGVSRERLDAELTGIAENACYDFFRSQLRYSSVRGAALIPFGIFGIAALASALLVLAISRPSWRRMTRTLKPENRKLSLLRALFFASKLGIAFLLVLIAGVEESRSRAAVLYGSKDPAAGPFLLWLFILGTMGALFWAVSDQRARCRVCLRLLCFPVRVGCPGCLLLNWSGTELLCSEGHGLLHVPHMAPSWDEQSERWISFDESWKELFTAAKL